MNIFVLDENPAIAAQYHCDKHVVKMILESCQLMSTAQHCVVRPASFIRHPIYKPTHINHPCSIWTRTCVRNYMWVHALCVGLCDEYTKRYGKIHKCQSSGLLDRLWVLDSTLPYWPRTPFVQAMPEEYRHEDPVVAYRNYYMGAKKDIAKWKLGNTPEWFV